MKFIVEEFEDILKLTGWFQDGLITGEEYFGAVDEYGKKVIKIELKQRSVPVEELEYDTLPGHKSWIEGQSIRGHKNPWWKLW